MTLTAVCAESIRFAVFSNDAKLIAAKCHITRLKCRNFYRPWNTQLVVCVKSQLYVTLGRCVTCNIWRKKTAIWPTLMSALKTNQCKYYTIDHRSNIGTWTCIKLKIILQLNIFEQFDLAINYNLVFKMQLLISNFIKKTTSKILLIECQESAICSQDDTNTVLSRT